MRIYSIKSNANIAGLSVKSLRSKSAVTRVTTETRLITSLDFASNRSRLPFKNTRKVIIVLCV